MRDTVNAYELSGHPLTNFGVVMWFSEDGEPRMRVEIYESGTNNFATSIDLAISLYV